jgi:polyisoprenyl-phosphate glycosyltransferase
MDSISIIVPCYNEQDNIERLCHELRTMFSNNAQYRWKVILIDDGSTDGTLQCLRRAAAEDSRFGYVALSRNFGKENALLAGFDRADTDCAVIMDADLQHPPTLIPEMVAAWKEGYDDVYAKRATRGKEPWLRRHLSMMYYRLLQRMARIDVLPNVGDFRLLDAKCIHSMRMLRETQRYTKGLYCWIGFRKKSIEFCQQGRTAGSSSFNYMRLIDLAIEGITSYTTAPLRISTVMGVIVSAVALLYMLYVLVKTLIVGDPVQGYPTLIIVILFLGGLQLLSLGILGEYLGRVFHETKHRPVYLVGEEHEASPKKE